MDEVIRSVIEFMTSVWLNDLYRKLILTVVIILGMGMVRYLVYAALTRRIPSESPYLYSVRKATSYIANFLIVLFLFGLWVERLSDLSIALGILAAGLAFALQEVIGSLAGWLTIVSGRPFSVGDRIETGGIRGDVVDVGILRTTLMETGNWLRGDHNTGRIVTVSNAYIFKEPLFNYSAHLDFLWDELSIPVTYESNWKKAVEIMLHSVQENPKFMELLPRAEEQRRQARRKLAVKLTPLTPRTFVKLTDNWIELGVVYPVATESRRSFRSELSQQILVEFEQAGITIASQTIAIVQFPANREDG